MGELSFLTIIVSLAVCSILVFAMYQYMKVRFTILEHSQKEQALILQQYIEESSYDIQGLQSIVFRHAQSQSQHQAQTGGSEPEEVFDDHNKHIHMDTVMYEAPNKQRSALIAISSDSEDTTSDESSDSEDSEDSEGSEGSEGSESVDSGDSEDSGSDIECDNVIHDIHEVKHIEISLPTDNDNNNNNNINELDIESVTIIDESSPEEPVAELPTETTEIKTITVDLGTSPDTSSMSTDTIDVLSLLNKTDEEHEVDTDLHFTAPISSSASASVSVSVSASASFQGLSVIELRALLKEKYKGQHDKITNLQKFKKPELIQLLHE
jgi:hypothetical protein